MLVDKSAWHPSFFLEDMSMRSVLEFDLPEDSQKLRECSNGPALSDVIKKFKAETEALMRESHGRPEADAYAQVLLSLDALLIDAGVFRTEL